MSNVKKKRKETLKNCKEQWVSMGRASRLMGVSRQWIHELIQRGDLQVMWVKVGPQPGGSRLVSVQSLRRVQRSRQA
jgi:hypothetical protein